MTTAPPDTRAHQLDMFDAFCARQTARIQQFLADPPGRGARERELRHQDQPDCYEQRGHASGPRRPSLSQLEGDDDN